MARYDIPPILLDCRVYGRIWKVKRSTIRLQFGQQHSKPATLEMDSTIRLTKFV
jgi:hypothetical protein